MLNVSVCKSNVSLIRCSSSKVKAFHHQVYDYVNYT